MGKPIEEWSDEKKMRWWMGLIFQSLFKAYWPVVLVFCLVCASLYLNYWMYRRTHWLVYRHIENKRAIQAIEKRVKTLEEQAADQALEVGGLEWEVQGLRRRIDDLEDLEPRVSDLESCDPRCR